MQKTEQTELPLIPAVTAQSGYHTYEPEEGGTWEYAYDISASHTRSECWIELLQATGISAMIAGAKPGDRRTADSMRVDRRRRGRGRGQPEARP